MPRHSCDELSRDDMWRTLTVQSHKFDYYRHETYFRESWQSATETLGPDAAWLMQRIVPVTVKPEGIRARCVSTCHEFMTANNFALLHVQRFGYDRHLVRELWRYQLNISTMDRIRLGDHLASQSDALLLCYLDRTDPLRIPATSRFVPLKGQGWPAQRTEHQLRSIVGSPNRMLVVVHSPDEPIDVVRELGVVFDRRGLNSLYDALATRESAGHTVTPDAELAALYADTEQRSLSVVDASTALLSELDAIRAGGAPTTRAAAEQAHRMLLAAMDGQRHLPLDEWVASLSACGVDATSWQVLLVASQYIQHDFPGQSCLINRSGRQKWAAGDGRIMSRSETSGRPASAMSR